MAGAIFAILLASPGAANADVRAVPPGTTALHGNANGAAIAAGSTATTHVVVDGPIRVASTPTSAPSPLWTALLSAGAALAGALVGFWSTRASSRATIIQKTNELEIESLDRRLAEFVGPFMLLSEENRTLAGELKRGQATPDEFRTLTGLLTPGWREGLSKGEANLLEAVVRNGTDLRRLLMEKGSATVSPQLLPFFSRASTHFRFLELAYAGSLDMDPARYSAYVYPREIDGIMEAERLRLQQRRELLRSEPHRAHQRMPDLALPQPGGPAGA